jgi:hypothetical protein
MPFRALTRSRASGLERQQAPSLTDGAAILDLMNFVPRIHQKAYYSCFFRPLFSPRLSHKKQTEKHSQNLSSVTHRRCEAGARTNMGLGSNTWEGSGHQMQLQSAEKYEYVLFQFAQCGYRRKDNDASHSLPITGGYIVAMFSNTQISLLTFNSFSKFQNKSLISRLLAALAI